MADYNTADELGSGKGMTRYIVEANHSDRPRVAGNTMINAGGAQQKKVFTLYQEG
jgi:hypothetical protein